MAERKNSRNRLQLIKEATPGTYDAAGERLMMSSLRGEFQPEEAWATFRPQGFDEDAWHALERTHRVWTGTVRFDYRQMPILLRMLCGEPSASATTNGVVEETFELSNGQERDIVTYTLEYGTPTDCERCTYALLVAISGSSERMGDSFEGNLTIICRKPVASGVAMTGGVRNEVQTLEETGTISAGNFTITVVNPVTGESATTANILASATASNIQTALEALSNVAPADVTVSGGPITTASVVLTFGGTFAGYDVPTVTVNSSGLTGGSINVVKTTQGQPLGNDLLARVPILNKNGSARRNDALSALAASTQINRQMMMGFDFGALVDPVFFFAENEDTFQSHVDGAEPTRTFPLRIAETSTDKADILSKVANQPATPQWWEYKWVHPDTEHSLAIQHYSSANAAAALTTGGNVRAREIPLSTVISDEEFSVRVIARYAE